MARKKKEFWDKEYKKAQHLALSENHSEDLEKFTRFLIRNYGKKFLNVTTYALDVGCGNGRNLIFLSKTFGIRGLGYDLSDVAIKEAKETASDLPLILEKRSLAEDIPLEDESVTLALDMMASHVLKEKDRIHLRDELVRVLKPGGWLFFKTFLLDDDKNAAQLLEKHPGPETGMYVHPSIKVPEYVWKEADLYPFFEPYFTIHKIERSHKHIDKHNRAWKRRTMSVYLEKK